MRHIFALESGFIDRVAFTLEHRLFSSCVVSLLNIFKTKCLSSKHGLTDSYNSLNLAHSSSMSPMSNWKSEHVALLDIRILGELGRTNMQDTMESMMLVVEGEDDIYGGGEKTRKLVDINVAKLE